MYEMKVWCIAILLIILVAGLAIGLVNGYVVLRVEHLIEGVHRQNLLIIYDVQE